MTKELKITFITEVDGKAYEVTGPEGETLKNVAVENGVPGIAAECGGACACGTCHVHVDQEWTTAVGRPNEAEESLLEFASDLRPNTRLSCQIRLTGSHDGLVVHIPPEQP